MSAVSDPFRVIADAVRRFGVEPASISLLAADENTSFRVIDTANRVTVARVHRPGLRTREELASEAVWLDALTAASFPVPAPLRTPDGDAHVPIETEDGSTWLGQLTWIAGTPLIDRLDEAPTRLRSLGALAAGLHIQTSEWTPPAGFCRPLLDADGLVGADPHWGRFWEHPILRPAEADVLVAARDALYRVISEMDIRAFGLIHGDLHVANVIVDDDVALVDFDDCGHGFWAFDLATALHPFRRSARFEILRDALLDGYHSAHDAAEVDEATVGLFGLVRLLSALGRSTVDEHDDRAEVRAFAVECVEAAQQLRSDGFS